MFGDYVVISLEKYDEIRDLYQKLSETEEQRKNMLQAYEDEYQTRLALQEENERLKNKNKSQTTTILSITKGNNKLKEENKQLKSLIKRNLNYYTNIKTPLN